METADPGLAVEIGEGAGDLQNAMEAAGGEAHGVGRLADELDAVAVRASRLLKRRRGAGRVGGDAVEPQRGVALLLQAARRRDTGSDLGRAFRRRGRIRSAAVTAGTSITRSMRSRRGPEIRAWYCAMQRSFGWRRQWKPGSVAWPQRQGFMAATSWKQAG